MNKFGNFVQTTNLIGADRTPCLLRKSLDNGADMIWRRRCDGAVKCCFRDLREELKKTHFPNIATAVASVTNTNKKSICTSKWYHYRYEIKEKILSVPATTTMSRRFILTGKRMDSVSWLNLKADRLRPNKAYKESVRTRITNAY